MTISRNAARGVLARRLAYCDAQLLMNAGPELGLKRVRDEAAALRLVLSELGLLDEEWVAVRVKHYADRIKVMLETRGPKG